MKSIDEMRKDGYPFKIIGNGGYPATLVDCQPLNDGDYIAVYHYPRGYACHSLWDVKSDWVKVIEQ